MHFIFTCLTFLLICFFVCYLPVCRSAELIGMSTLLLIDCLTSPRNIKNSAAMLSFNMLSVLNFLFCHLCA